MERYEYNQILHERYPDIEHFSEIERTFRKIQEHIGSHEKVMISVSGGSDSDCIVHILCTYFPEYLEKCCFVFVNTGLEFRATLRHLDYLEQRYGIKIDRIRGKSVVWVVKNYGVPILSKLKSEMIRKYCKGAAWAERYIFGNAVKEYKSMKYTEQQKELVRYIKEHDIKISAECCKLSKKNPLHKYTHEHGIDLNVTGERKAEGGQRALAHKSCFESGDKRTDKYMPLWWWSDSVKADFKQTEGIRYSDCYEVYGMKRTGCVGCPFNLRIGEDLKVMQIAEPQLYKACMNVFGESYRLVDQFHARSRKCIPDDLQERLFDME